MLIFRILPGVKSQQCRHLSNLSTPYHILRNYFELDYNNANRYVDKHKLSDKDAGMIVKNIEYCKKLGYNNEEILNNPLLLRTNSNTLEHQYLALIEGGFDPITPRILAKFRTCANRRISLLKSLKFIKSETNVYQNFLKYIQPLPENFQIELYDDNEIWKHLHYRILIKYLAMTLDTTDGRIAAILDSYRGIKLKSFQVICKNVQMARDLGFTNEKILSFPHILGATPKHLEEILEKCPTLIGNDIRDVIRLYPKLFCTTSESIHKILDILKRFNISDESIQKNLNIFYMSPETIEYRLEELRRVPEFKVLVHNPWILRLILHHNRAKSRLEFMRKLHLKCNGVGLLSNDKDEFDVYIREGRDKNTYYDVLMFINGVFNINNIEKSMDIFEKLKKHQYYIQVPLTTIQNTFDYLIKEQKFQRSSVLEAIWILLYHRENIKKAFKQINRLYGNNEQRITQIKKLNLALYFIEKEHNFTGNGIWLIQNELIHDEH